MTEHVIFNISLEFSQHEKILQKSLFPMFCNMFFSDAYIFEFLDFGCQNQSPAALSLAKKMQTKKDHGTAKQKPLKFLFSI